MKHSVKLKILLIALAVIFISGCSSIKHKSGNADILDKTGVETKGLGADDKFSDQESANKMKAPYDQVYYFDYDKDAIHQEDNASVNLQGNYLVSHPSARVRIEGHTDERGSREYNVALGWRRAKAISAILEQQGVNAKQIVTISFGKEKPVAFTHDEAAYSLNRRVNLIYEAK